MSKKHKKKNNQANAGKKVAIPYCDSFEAYKNFYNENKRKEVWELVDMHNIILSFIGNLPKPNHLKDYKIYVNYEPAESVCTITLVHKENGTEIKMELPNFYRVSRKMGWVFKSDKYASKNGWKGLIWDTLRNSPVYDEPIREDRIEVWGVNSVAMNLLKEFLCSQISASIGGDFSGSITLGTIQFQYIDKKEKSIYIKTSVILEANGERESFLDITFPVFYDEISVGYGELRSFSKKKSLGVRRIATMQKLLPVEDNPLILASKKRKYCCSVAKENIQEIAEEEFAPLKVEVSTRQNTNYSILFYDILDRYLFGNTICIDDFIYKITTKNYNTDKCSTNALLEYLHSVCQKLKKEIIDKNKTLTYTIDTVRDLYPYCSEHNIPLKKNVNEMSNTVSSDAIYFNIGKLDFLDKCYAEFDLETGKYVVSTKIPFFKVDLQTKEITKEGILADYYALLEDAKFTEALNFAKQLVSQAEQQGYEITRCTGKGMLSGKGDFRFTKNGQENRVTLKTNTYKRNIETWKDGLQAFFDKTLSEFDGVIAVKKVENNSAATKLFNNYLERDIATIVLTVPYMSAEVLAKYLAGEKYITSYPIYKPEVYEGKYKGYYDSEYILKVMHDMSHRNLLRTSFVEGWSYHHSSYTKINKLKATSKVLDIDESQYSISPEEMQTMCRDKERRLSDFEASYMFQTFQSKPESTPLSLVEYMMLLKTFDCYGFLTEHLEEVVKYIEKAPAVIKTMAHGMAIDAIEPVHLALQNI